MSQRGCGFLRCWIGLFKGRKEVFFGLLLPAVDFIASGTSGGAVIARLVKVSPIAEFNPVPSLEYVVVPNNAVYGHPFAIDKTLLFAFEKRIVFVCVHLLSKNIGVLGRIGGYYPGKRCMHNLGLEAVVGWFDESFPS